MTKTQIALGVATLALGVAVLPKLALAYRGDSSVHGPNYTPERHAAMTKAFENKDYEAWKKLANQKGRVTQVINAGNFAKFAKMHELKIAGKTVEADQIRAELGLGQKNGSGMGRYQNSK